MYFSTLVLSCLYESRWGTCILVPWYYLVSGIKIDPPTGPVSGIWGTVPPRTEQTATTSE